MRCRNCGHQNPEQNRYCGMCGHVVAQPSAEPEYVVEKVPMTAEPQSGEATRIVGDEPRHDAVNEPPAAEPARRGDKWWVEDGEGDTSVGGPSFLGLGSNEPGGYSYLFDEEPRSRVGTWIFLLVLLAAGGVLYAKWRPIRDYVLTTALSHTRPAEKTAAQDPAKTPDQAQAPASSAPTTTLASSDAPSQPPIVTDDSKNSQPQKQQGVPPNEAQPDKRKIGDAGVKADANAEPDNAVPAEPKTSKPQNRKAQAAGEEASDGSAGDSAADAAEDKTSPARSARAEPTNPGSELVTSGERYLYGRGVARNCDQAVSYFNAAAAKQNPQAFSHLGALYATGECVPMDRAVAYAWFRRAYAKEPGNHYFEQNLTMLWREMTPDERQRATGTRTASF